VEESKPLIVGQGAGFNFGEGNYRDAAYLGDCDAAGGVLRTSTPLTLNLLRRRRVSV
jgi:hypothetical protein